jgi:capsular exopolysaccharide synthesis family protein
LGIIMAQAGARVVVVDADFRRSTLHRLLAAVPNGHKPFWSSASDIRSGLSNAIVGDVSVSDVVSKTRFADLALVPAGITPPNPSELLGSERMRTVLAELAGQADYILLDSPPCALYTDAVVLSRLADGVLYVLRSGSQDKVLQRRIQKQLEQAKVRLLGVIFNGADVEDDVTSYGYYYPNGKKRHE